MTNSGHISLRSRSFIRLAAGAALVFALSLSTPAFADTAVDTYCSPTGDYCQGVFRKASGDFDFKLTTFSLRGTVDVCVRKRGRSRICQTRRLKPAGGGLFEASARWGRNWPKLGRGTYFVSWYYEGSRVGRILAFRR